MNHIKGIYTLLKATLVANKAHEGQCRRYTGEPYITHPIAVARILYKHINLDYTVLAAAILHDTVEDTELTSQDIYRLFGKEICELVQEVTDVSKLGDGNRAVRKAMDRAYLANASPRVKTIKLADMMHNTPSTMKHGKRFANIYLLEMNLLVDVLEEGNEVLLDKTKHMLNCYKGFN